jgi:release factor glutamine methyltransferase
VDSPRLQAELLLAHVLSLKRMQLYLNFERVLSTEEADRAREIVRRRGEREPLQQIVGSTSFCGLEIVVNRHVLAPRPETELLAERGWRFLKDSFSPSPASVGLRRGKDGEKESNLRAVPLATICAEGRDGPLTPALSPSEGERESPGTQGASRLAFDLGTGSGCMAIAVAVNCPGCRVVAADISAEALTTAKQNALTNGVAERIEFRRGNGFEVVGQGEQFDLIISNPPYIPTEEIASLQTEVRDYEPRGALDGGADGLDWYRRIAAEAGAFLSQEGKVMLEFGDGQAEAIRKIFEEQKWIVEAVIEDYTRRPRIVIAAKIPA